LGNGSIDSMLNTHTLINTKVSSFWVNGIWNVMELGNIIPHEVLIQILSILLQLDADDNILFNISFNGRFKLNLVWDIFREKQVESMVFKNLWSNCIPVSYYILAWRCIKGFLPMDNRLWNKGFLLPSKSQCCFNFESIEHVFINSHMDKTVWRFFSNSVNNTCTVTSNENIYAMLSKWMIPAKGHIVNILPIFILWYIWKARNESKHKGIKIDANVIISNVNYKVSQCFYAKLIKEKDFKNCGNYAEAIGTDLNVDQVGNRERLVSWLKPSQFFFKLNTDGSVNRLSAGMGRILRDCYGEVILAFAGPLYLCKAIFAELVGLHKGLELCLSKGFYYVQVEVDAVLVTQLINKEISVNPQYFYLIKKIQMAISKLNCSLSHIFRECNFCADWLAKFGCSSTSDIIFKIDKLPEQLLNLVRRDNLGLS